LNLEAARAEVGLPDGTLGVPGNLLPIPASELDNGFACGYFNGGIGSGSELRTWEGLTSGYEGTLIGNFGPVYSLAIEQGVIQPPDPEWWPA
jgi:hypothetical protein